MTSEKNKLNYGIKTCHNMLDKLKFEGKRLDENWHEYDSFNFIITAWHLYFDWLNNDSKNRPKLATRKKELPKTTVEMMKVIYTLRDIANSSKHLSLHPEAMKKKVVSNIHPPKIACWSSYFLHGSQIGISVGNSYYSMWDLRHLVLLYFDWVFDDNIPANQFPKEIKEHLKRCIAKK